MQDKHFTFFDASSPLYMVVNTEVAEGSPSEIFPTTIKRLGYLFLFAFCLGSFSVLWGSKQVNEFILRNIKTFLTILVKRRELRLKKSKKTRSTA